MKSNVSLISASLLTILFLLVSFSLKQDVAEATVQAFIVTEKSEFTENSTDIVNQTWHNGDTLYYKTENHFSSKNNANDYLVTGTHYSRETQRSGKSERTTNPPTIYDGTSSDNEKYTFNELTSTGTWHWDSQSNNGDPVEDSGVLPDLYKSYPMSGTGEIQENGQQNRCDTFNVCQGHGHYTETKSSQYADSHGTHSIDFEDTWYTKQVLVTKDDVNPSGSRIINLGSISAHTLAIAPPGSGTGKMFTITGQVPCSGITVAGQVTEPDQYPGSCKISISVPNNGVTDVTPHVSADYYETSISVKSVGPDTCKKISGNGPIKVVFMKGESWNPSPSQFSQQYDNVIYNGFKSIEPFSSYFDQFSFYADLKSVPNEANFPHTRKDLSTLDQETSDMLVNQSSCGTDAKLYLFYQSTSNGLPYHYDAFSHWNNHPVAYFDLKSAVASNPIVAIHEAVHVLAGIYDEYLYAQTVDENLQHWGLFNLSATTGWSLKNCVETPTWQFRGNDNHIYGAVSPKLQGCSFLKDPNSDPRFPINYYRPSPASIMNANAGTGKFNVISCGYIIAAIKGEPLTQKVAAEHWAKECTVLEKEGELEPKYGIPEINLAPSISGGQSSMRNSWWKSLLAQVIQSFSGIPGGNVVLTGTNFTPENNAVRITNNKTGEYYEILGIPSVDSNHLSFTLPTTTPKGRYTLKVGAFNSDWSASIPLTILTSTVSNAPTLTKISPSTLVMGGKLEIYGTNFIDGPDVTKVTFTPTTSGLSTKVITGADSPTRIDIVHLDISPGNYMVSVTTPEGISNVLPITITPSLTVTSPASNATVMKGSNLTIEWSVSPENVSQSMTQFFAEFIKESNGQKYGMPDKLGGGSTFPVSGTTRSVDVTIPNMSWFPAGEYRIHVWGYGNGSKTVVDDISDEPFIINESSQSEILPVKDSAPSVIRGGPYEQSLTYQPTVNGPDKVFDSTQRVIAEINHNGTQTWNSYGNSSPTTAESVLTINSVDGKPSYVMQFSAPGSYQLQSGQKSWSSLAEIIVSPDQSVFVNGRWDGKQNQVTYVSTGGLPPPFDGPDRIFYRIFKLPPPTTLQVGTYLYITGSAKTGGIEVSVPFTHGVQKYNIESMDNLGDTTWSTIKTNLVASSTGATLYLDTRTPPTSGNPRTYRAKIVSIAPPPTGKLEQLWETASNFISETVENAVTAVTSFVGLTQTQSNPSSSIGILDSNGPSVPQIVVYVTKFILNQYAKEQIRKPNCQENDVCLPEKEDHHNYAVADLNALGLWLDIQSSPTPPNPLPPKPLVYSSINKNNNSIICPPLQSTDYMSVLHIENSWYYNYRNNPTGKHEEENACGVISEDLYDDSGSFGGATLQGKGDVVFYKYGGGTGTVLESMERVNGDATSEIHLGKKGGDLGTRYVIIMYVNAKTISPKYITDEKGRIGTTFENKDVPCDLITFIDGTTVNINNKAPNCKFRLDRNGTTVWTWEPATPTVNTTLLYSYSVSPYAVVVAQTPPTINSSGPGSVASGESLTISGSGFSTGGDNWVRLNKGTKHYDFSDVPSDGQVITVQLPSSEKLPPGNYELQVATSQSEWSTPIPLKVTGASRLIKPTLEINFPNEGSTLAKGGAYPLSWSVSPNSYSGSTEFYAEFINASTSQKYGMAGDALGTTPSPFPVAGDIRIKTIFIPSLSWFPTGQYKIHMWGYGANNTVLNGESGIFTIEESPEGPPPSLTITSLNSGGTWVRGTPKTISWSVSPLSKFPSGNTTFGIWLVNQTYRDSYNLTSQALGGTARDFTYTLPENIATGSYILQVLSYVGGKMLAYDYTDTPLTVVPAPNQIALTISNPATEETWTKGQPQTIGWSVSPRSLSSSMISFNAQLINTSTHEAVTLTTYSGTTTLIPGSVRTATVIPPNDSTLPPGQYMLKLSGQGEGGSTYISDLSDEVITIVEP